jgi:catechol 2,3-dioxygenase-like lactoylglutathione lyase family enzyme
MAQGARLGTVVVFVHDLDRSVDFYTDVLELGVADRSPTAALLSNDAGTQLVLRAMGLGAERALGAVGVQYVIWTASGKDCLDRCEQAMRRRGAYRETRGDQGVTVVEARDPDDLAVVVAYPGPDQVPMHQLPPRIYGW